MTERDVLVEQLKDAAQLLTEQREWVWFLMAERSGLLALIEQHGSDALLAAARAHLQASHARLPAAIGGPVVH